MCGIWYGKREGRLYRNVPGGVTEAQYGKKAALAVNDFSLLENMYDPAWEMAPPANAVVFVDSHLSQRDNSIPAGEARGC